MATGRVPGSGTGNTTAGKPVQAHSSQDRVGSSTFLRPCIMLVSLVIPVLNESDNVRLLWRRLADVVATIADRLGAGVVAEPVARAACAIAGVVPALVARPADAAELAAVLAGSFVVETVFQLPGIGRQFVLAAQQRDYTLVMGVVLVYAVLIILLNLAADLAYRGLDPRSRTP